MPKITLPLQVKCWRCEGRGYVLKPYSREESLLDCDCDDGERYVFDDLAQAANEAGYFVKMYDYGYFAIALIPKENEFDCVAYEKAPDPTTALLNAITKFNEEN